MKGYLFMEYPEGVGGSSSVGGGGSSSGGSSVSGDRSDGDRETWLQKQQR